MANLQLEVIDKIEFLANGELRTIELNYGDITTLPNDQKADLLMISAFHGDYTPTPGSLVGALQRNLGLSVRKLAEDKEEDLRKLFYCWWSKPLPADLPYRRLLCFESSRSGQTPQQAVQAIFKVLVAASGLFTDGVVISPLLSTGDQGYSPVTMLTAMVNSAVVWMENGLNIKRLKLVLYRGHTTIHQCFKGLKSKYHQEPHMLMRFKAIRPPKIDYDFYVSADEKDEENVNKIKEMFSEHKKDLTFYFLTKTESISEDAIFTNMKKCSRVLTFLSPSYLNNDVCMDEYNAAWCLNKTRVNQTKLAPLLCKTIPNIPTYISLVQWVDIRIRDGNTEKMVKNVTLYVMSYVQGGSSDVISAINDAEGDDSDNTPVEDENDVSTATDPKDEYDIFISYAHADSVKVNQLVSTLQEKIPDVRIFLDREELHTGGSWQERLYHCVEFSRVVVACLSPSYLKSKMCTEEFRISLACHYTQADFILVPIQIEPCGDLPDAYTLIRNSSLQDDSLEYHVENKLVPAVSGYLKEDSRDGTFIPISKELLSLSALLEDGRASRLDRLLQTEPVIDVDSVKSKKFVVEVLVTGESLEREIAQNIGDYLSKMGILVEINDGSRDNSTVLIALDKADMIIALISVEFIVNPDLVGQLQVAINRHRYSKDGKAKLYPVLMTNDLNHAPKFYFVYFDLLSYECCFTDSVWSVWNIDKTLEEHPNYEPMMLECRNIQLEFEEGTREILLKKGNEAITTKKLKKDRRIETLKFATVISNRTIYHINTISNELDVLVDISHFLHDSVMGKQQKELQSKALFSEIEEKYTGKSSTEAKGTESKSGTGRDDIQKQQSSSCNLI